MNDISGKRGLLVLDLDECLIYGADAEMHRTADLRVGPYHVYCRPHVAEFLNGAAEWYELAVWSSASTDYVGGITSQIRPVSVSWKFVWARERCTPRMDAETRENVYLKDLRKVKRLGYSLERILFVDDTPQKLARNYGNAIYVSPFEGADDDTELPKLLRFLESIHKEPNFRKIEKRGWRSRT